MSNITGVVRVGDKRNGMGIINNKITELNLIEEIKSGEKILVGDPKGLKNKFEQNIGGNVLVEGPLGSGKTYLLKSIVEQILINDKNNKCYVISWIEENLFEFKNNELKITGFVTEKEDILKLLISLNKEAYRRKNIRDISNLERITVAIDDLINIIKPTEVDKDKSISSEIEKEVMRFARLGRSSKMNLILSRNSSFRIIDDIESNIETRIVAGDRVGDFKLR